MAIAMDGPWRDPWLGKNLVADDDFLTISYGVPENQVFYMV